MHRTCHIIGLPKPGPIATVGSRRGVNESQSLAATYYMHNLFRGGMRLKQVRVGGKPGTRVHHWLVAKASIKHVEGIGADPRTLYLGGFESLICTEVKNHLGAS
jgi:hypothetical protein